MFFDKFSFSGKINFSLKQKNCDEPGKKRDKLAAPFHFLKSNPFMMLSIKNWRAGRQMATFR